MEFNTIPHMNAVANQTYCNGETAPLTSLGSTVTGTTFVWTNSNTNIGLAANGNECSVIQRNQYHKCTDAPPP